MWIIVEDSRANMNSTGSGEMLLYNNGGEKEFVSVVFKEENFWLTQSGMAELLDCSTDSVSLHLKNVYAEEELEKLSPAATTEKFTAVCQEGARSVSRKNDHYNLDAVIASVKTARLRGGAAKKEEGGAPPIYCNDNDYGQNA